MRLRLRFTVALFLMGVAILFQACAHSDAPTRPMIEASVPFAPQLVQSAEWQNLAYEINLSVDLRAQGYTLDRLDVLDGADPSKVVASFRCETLERQLVYLNPSDGGSAITAVGVWIHLEQGNGVPASLVHHFRFLRNGSEEVMTLTGARTPVDLAPVRVIAPPLKGVGLGAFEIGEATTHHFLSLVLFGRASRNPQRWASDWSLLTTDGRLYTGTGKENADYPGWGTNYYAVADGTVVEAVDILPDQACWPGKITDPLILANPAGNHVVVDIGQGHFAVYGHCQSKSVGVKAGDRVTVGQVLAKMGNTGMSDCPHLHFQISNAKDVFNADSVPYVVDKYVYLGRADYTSVMAYKGAYEAFDTPRSLSARIFDQGTVVSMGP